MTNIYLIRHAEAEGNVFRRLQGQYDSLVTPNGRRQIAALEARFADIPIDVVYASDLTRTCITAGAIYKPKQLLLQKDRRLREIGTGIWENLPFGWLEHSDPERNRAFSHSPKTWGVEGSEACEVYTGRFLEALREIAQKHEGQSVAIFSHGMVLRGALQTLFFDGEENAVAHCENTAVTYITYENGSFSLQYLNDASHITPEISTLGRQMWWRGEKYKDFNMWYRDATQEDAQMLQRLGCTDGAVRVSMLADEPTGAVCVRDGVLQCFSLLPEYRGRGLSMQLLGEAISMARAQGHSTLRLASIPEDPAALHVIALCGFQNGELNIIPHID